MQDILSTVQDSLRNYFQNNVKGRSHWGYIDDETGTNIFDVLISRFSEPTQNELLQIIMKRMKSLGTKRIMDQGCGFGSSLEGLVRRYAGLSDIELIGYAVSGDLSIVNLPRSIVYGTDFDDSEIHERLGFESFGYEKSGENYRFVGAEEDVHLLMGQKFPFGFDLVFSKMTYCHLEMPWIAFQRTVNSLAVGGVAVIDSMEVYTHIDSVVNNGSAFDCYKSRYDGVVAVVKNKDSRFVTDLHYLDGQIAYLGKSVEKAIPIDLF